MADRRAAAHPPWNVVAMAKPRAGRDALKALQSIGAFRNAPYPGVFLGRLGTSDAGAFVADAYERHPEQFRDVARLMPIEDSVVFGRDDVTEALCEALEPHAARVAGKRFHVRARLRGLKGRVERQAVERAIGGFLLQRCEELGSPAQVTFDDPDLVVVAEVIGRRVGYGLLDRSLLAVPVIRPR